MRLSATGAGDATHEFHVQARPTPSFNGQRRTCQQVHGELHPARRQKCVAVGHGRRAARCIHAGSPANAASRCSCRTKHTSIGCCGRINCSATHNAAPHCQLCTRSLYFTRSYIQRRMPHRAVVPADASGGAGPAGSRAACSTRSSVCRSGREGVRSASWMMWSSPVNGPAADKCVKGKLSVVQDQHQMGSSAVVICLIV